jgi:aspartyl-tRNA(Asn)/glutamyl-tRNA(Gln) amidotransferase subunit B
LFLRATSPFARRHTSNDPARHQHHFRNAAAAAGRARSALAGRAREDGFKGETGDWEVVIGMEVHAQVASNAKLFSGASTEFGAEPNSHVSLVDAGHAGHAAGHQQGMRRAGDAHRPRPQGADQPEARCSTGRTISIRTCRRATRSPVQAARSSARARSIPIDVDRMGKESIEVGIERLHLEQDAGKSLHDQHPRTMSYVDLNRSGRGADGDRLEARHALGREAKAYVTKLRTILRYLGTCDGDMEKGNPARRRERLGAPAVSRANRRFGTRCEIKNVNSIRFIGRPSSTRRAARSRSSRTAARSIRKRGCSTAGKGETRSMRSKEEAHDYRYFPDPDLLPLEFDEAYVDEFARTLPELPDEKKARFMKDYGFRLRRGVLIAERESADFFEAVAKGRDAKLAANWVINELFGRAQQGRPRRRAEPGLGRRRSAASST